MSHLLDSAVRKDGEEDAELVRMLLWEDELVPYWRENSLLGSAIYAGAGAEMVKLLVGKGGNVNEVWLEGDTMLSWASYSGQVAVVRYLLEQGAKVEPFAIHWGESDDIAAESCC